MTRDNILQAREEALRFLDRADEALSEIVGTEGYIVGTRISGALRRSSLDLTRALSDMRRAA